MGWSGIIGKIRQQSGHYLFSRLWYCHQTCSMLGAGPAPAGSGISMLLTFSGKNSRTCLSESSSESKSKFYSERDIEARMHCCERSKSTHLSGRRWTCQWVAHMNSQFLGFSISKGGFFLNFVAQNSDSAFWLGGVGLVPNMVLLGNVIALVPSPPSIYGIRFNYNDGIMSFGISLWSIFPPLWVELILASPYCCWLLWSHMSFLP